MAKTVLGKRPRFRIAGTFATSSRPASAKAALVWPSPNAQSATVSATSASVHSSDASTRASVPSLSAALPARTATAVMIWLSVSTAIWALVPVEALARALVPVAHLGVVCRRHPPLRHPVMQRRSVVIVAVDVLQQHLAQRLRRFHQRMVFL